MVVARMSDLLEEIEKLSLNDRIELLEALWESIEAETSVLTEAERSELDIRLAAFEPNRSAVIPWDQVRAELAEE